MTPEERSQMLGKVIEAWPYVSELDKAWIMKIIAMSPNANLNLAQFRRAIVEMSPTSQKELLELMKAMKRTKEGTETSEDRELLASARKEMRIELARRRRLGLHAKRNRAGA